MAAEPRKGLPSGAKASGPLSKRRRVGEEWSWHTGLSGLEGEWVKSRTLALIAPLLQLGVPEGNPAHGGVGMATRNCEILPYPSSPISNATFLKEAQPPFEHSFPPYVVICVYTIVW